MKERHSDLVRCVLQEFSAPVDLKLTASRLDISHIARIAAFRTSDQHHVQLHHTSRVHVDDNHQFLKETFDKGKTIYGVNTGFGGSANVITNDAVQTQLALLHHLNCGTFGKTLPPGIVKAVMLVRANSLSLGRSGVRAEVIDLLCGMINHDIVPMVPLRGTVSSSGDLMCLSYIAATMNGSKKDSLVYYKGVKNVTAQEAFKRAGLAFIEFQHKEALGVINSASCSSTMASDNLFHFGYLMLLTEVVTAMSVEALHGRMESFDSMVYECLSHEGMQEVSENVNSLLEGSKLVRRLLSIKTDLKKENVENSLQNEELVQDRYALRTSPQWLSSVVETFKESVRRVRVEINSTCDNPLVDHNDGKIIHGGNFQGVNVTVAMDQTRQGVQMCGRLMFAQLSEVLNDQMNLILSPNLSGTDHYKDFGFKGIDTALAAYTSELDSIATPMTNHILSAEMHNQSVNSMALVSSRKTREGLEILKLIIASSLLALCQAVDLRWLRHQIFLAWETSFKDIGAVMTNCKSKMKKYWYNVAFRFSAETPYLHAILASNSIQENTEDRKKFLKIFKAKCEGSVEKLYEGIQESEVAKMLGKGTKKIYEFVRKDLGVKFNNGTKTLDGDCEKILNSLESDQMRAVINEIFDVHSTNGF